MLCEKLKMMRKERNLSQKDVADYLNISAQSISKWEKGDALPSVEFLPKIAMIFKCSIDDLFAEEKQILNAECETVKRYLATETLVMQEKITLERWEELLSEIPNYYEYVLNFFIWLEKRKTLSVEQLSTRLGCTKDDALQIIQDLVACEIITPLDIDDTYFVYSVEGAKALLVMHREFYDLKNELSAKELADKIKSCK